MYILMVKRYSGNLVPVFCSEDRTKLETMYPEWRKKANEDIGWEAWLNEHHITEVTLI